MTNGLYAPELLANGVVVYWSVYHQAWKTAESEIDIPDREWAAMPKADRVAILQHMAGHPCDDFKGEGRSC